MDKLTEEELDLLQRVRESSISNSTPSPKARLKRKRKLNLSKFFYALGAIAVFIGLFLAVAFNIALLAFAEQFGPLEEAIQIADALKGVKEWELLFGGASSFYDMYITFSRDRWLISGMIITGFSLLGAIFFAVGISKGKNE